MYGTSRNHSFSDCNHVLSVEWKRYDPDEQLGAFNQALRELELQAGGDLVDPSTDAKIRDDFAHFEQTLFILQRTERDRDGGGTGPRGNCSQKRVSGQHEP